MKSPFYIQQTGKEEEVCPCGEREKGGEDVTVWNPHNAINGDINGHHCFAVDLGNIQPSSRCSHPQFTDSTPHIIVKIRHWLIIHEQPSR